MAMILAKSLLSHANQLFGIGEGLAALTCFLQLPVFLVQELYFFLVRRLGWAGCGKAGKIEQEETQKKGR